MKRKSLFLGLIMVISAVIASFAMTMYIIEKKPIILIAVIVYVVLFAFSLPLFSLSVMSKLDNDSGNK
jgi:cation transporter-like permease